MPKVLTAKELKRHWRPLFEASPDEYYPSKVFEDFKMERYQCVECGHYFRRVPSSVDPEHPVCGDSSCLKKYSFIGKAAYASPPSGEERWTLNTVWSTFSDFMTTQTEPKHTIVPRYPVVARWRDDCEYTAAGIQCYQPFCVTGEVDPPANPLIQPQFCLRFNDLDSIGLSGRHYSGFNMIGIQVFNKAEDHKYWKEDIVRFNVLWLTTVLRIPIEEITLSEDVWAGGGNLGACVEMFVRGLEVGNMVFMEYKTQATSYDLSKLTVQVIDVGIGMERLPWLLNGSVTSYVDAFPTALTTAVDRLGMSAAITSPEWEAFGPLSSLLNIDELDGEEELAATWADIEKETGVTGVREAVEPVRDLYVVLDHLRSLFVAIHDGSLPSNVGGGSNLRNVLRRVFNILKSRKTASGSSWFDAIGQLDGIMDLFEAHHADLERLHGEGSFPTKCREEAPLTKIVAKELEAWQQSDIDGGKKLNALLKKRKGKPLGDKDWITIVTSYGISPEDAVRLSGGRIKGVPGTLYTKLAELQERTAKEAKPQLYETSTIAPTRCLFAEDGTDGEMAGECDANVIGILENMEDTKAGRNIVLLDTTVMYPNGGGQDTDLGVITIEGVEYSILRGERVGQVVLHYVSSSLPEMVLPVKAHIAIDLERREQLTAHHTAAHIIHSAAHHVLGSHIWQAGAHKSVDKAHLDITHYKAVEYSELQAIEAYANAIVRRCAPIGKFTLKKDEAERRYGFSLYQGGVVPGNSVRCVHIGEDTRPVDVEACCGTHCSNTGQVGFIRVLKANRISAGVVRVHFTAGARAIAAVGAEERIIHDICRQWSVEPSHMVKTAERFFSDSVTFGRQVVNLQDEILTLHFQAAVSQPAGTISSFKVSAEKATMYISALRKWGKQIIESEVGVVFVAPTFIWGIVPTPACELTTQVTELLLPKGPDDKLAKWLEKQKASQSKAKPSVQIQKLSANKKGVVSIARKKLKKGETFVEQYCLMGLYNYNPDLLVPMIKSIGLIQ